ncbi:TPA: 3-phosphoshikimate 1-carboxyvinyltransferase [Candidatus Marinimicrobia bacterium]|nr:MAG: 3-phosphoshikimate 1-carboxyvinyltransferase [Marinimicrobia bacterium 46_47]KUK91773.1 MAG: 3-phosphoshikimate 1-carboxyvinyltransferase [Marinimicrobia bacterium 46_43]HAE87594.1 3-phosphoshikimate 1-carboxyvinyltransferase [Candidatus Neomarinimicrobiota bacterium]HBY18162.1 3-phosphoshikimate 1-carboxyvinyltransferase [Candidatus Neomarinimicrobiota bacterium]
MIENTCQITPAERVRGNISLPGDKSISHRALIFAAIARGKSKICHLNTGVDVLSTIACLQKVGVHFQLGRYTVNVKSPGLHGWSGEDRVALNCGNSGTTTRLLTGLLAGQSFESVLYGDESLSRRPMGRIIEPLTQMNALFKSTEGHLPLTIFPSKLKGIRYTLPVASAQVKSAILLAGLLAEGKTHVTEPVQCRDHTERMMKMLGIPIFKKKNTWTVHTLKRPVPGFEYNVPADPSSAAFWVAAALLLPKSRIVLNNVSLNPTRIAFLRLLQKAGADISCSEETRSYEPYGDIVVKSSELQGFSISSRSIPGLIDEIPILALIATQAKGITRIRGARELRVKESDRIATTVACLKALGAEIEEYEDGMTIQGPTPLHGGTVKAYMDHRIAMTMAIAGLIASDPVNIEDYSVVDISYPDFFSTLEKIRQ